MVVRRYNEYVVCQCVCNSRNAKYDVLNINEEEVELDVLVVDIHDICFECLSIGMSFFKTNKNRANWGKYTIIATQFNQQ